MRLRIAGVTVGAWPPHLQGAAAVLAAEEHFAAVARQARRSAPHG